MKIILKFNFILLKSIMISSLLISTSNASNLHDWKLIGKTIHCPVSFEIFAALGETTLILKNQKMGSRTLRSADGRGYESAPMLPLMFHTLLRDEARLPNEAIFLVAIPTIDSQLMPKLIAFSKDNYFECEF